MHANRSKTFYSPLSDQPLDVEASVNFSRPLDLLRGNLHDVNGRLGLHDNVKIDDAQILGKSAGSKRTSRSENNSILWAFIIFLVLVIATLPLLRFIDSNHAGFVSTYNTSVVHYAAKFGPTTIFVLAIAFWRKFDLYIKMSAPWKEMSKGFSPADKTLLLDYVSPILLSTLKRALCNRHWEVVASIAVFAALKSSVFFSTGLLNIQPVTISSQARMLVLNTGKALSMHEAHLDMKGVARSYVAVKERGLPWPNGTLANAAFQEISPDNSLPHFSNITADVMAIYPWLECEPAVASFFATTPAISSKISTFSSSDLVPDYHFDWTSRNTNGTRRFFSELFCNPSGRNVSCPQSEVSHYLSPISWRTNNNSSLARELSYDKNAFLLITYALGSRMSPGTVPYNYSSGNGSLRIDEVPGYGWIQYMNWTSALACKVEYAVELGRLLSLWSAKENSWVANTLSDNLTYTKKQVWNYTTTNLTWDIAILASHTASYAKTPNSMYTGWLDLMLDAVASDDPIVFRNSAEMARAANNVFKGLASTWFGSWANFQQHPSTNGTYTYDTTRLRMSHTAFWLTEISLFIGLSLVAIFFLSDRKSKLPHTLGTILQNARVFSTNKRTLTFWTKLVAYRDETVRKSLESAAFRTTSELMVEPEFDINYRTRDISDSIDSLTRSTWTPVPSKHWYIAVLVIVILLVIFALEAVQRISNQPPVGIALSMTRTNAEYLTSFLTASIMLAISTLFSSAESVVTGLAPYLLLRRKAAPLRAFQATSTQRLPPINTIQQLGSRQYGVAFVAMSALIGSILTIVGSGLFGILDDAKSYHPTMVATADRFDMNVSLSANNKGTMLFTFMQENNGSFANGTYDEFAFPTLVLNHTDPKIAPILARTRTSTRIGVEVPVLRASLNCSKTSASNLIFNITNRMEWNPKMNWGAYYVQIISNHRLPSYCQLTAPTYDDSEEYSVRSFEEFLTLSNNSSVIHGAEMDLIRSIPPDVRAQNTSDGDHNHANLPPGCPSAAFTIGVFGNNKTNSSMVTRMVCSQYWEEVPATLELWLPSMRLNTEVPPVLHEERAKLVSHLNWNFTQIFGYSTNSSVISGNGKERLDPFYNVLVYGIDGVPLVELLGHDRYERFFNATQHIYRQYMAQIIGNDLRTENKTTSVASPTTAIGTQCPANVIDTASVRVIQNHTTKLILQSLLAAMVVCLLIGYRDLRACGNTLTHNPFHIAGRVSLVADSKLADFIDWSQPDRELLKEHGRTKLRLGWWKVEREPNNESPREGIGSQGYTNRARTLQDADAVHQQTQPYGFQAKRKPLPSSPMPARPPKPSHDSPNPDENLDSNPQPNEQSMLLREGEAQWRFGIDIDGARPFFKQLPVADNKVQSTSSTEHDILSKLQGNKIYQRLFQWRR